MVQAVARLGKLLIASSKVALTSPCGLAAAYVDLRPVLPGHSIVAPIAGDDDPPPRLLSDMKDASFDALVRTVSEVCDVGTKSGATAHNIAIMDGKAAGQPELLPHVHVHVVPRRAGDLENSDEIYDRIDRWSPEGPPNTPPEFDMPSDDARKPRTAEQMAAEASQYAAHAAEKSLVSAPLPSAPETFRFGKFDLDASQLFFASPLCVASVNLKPLCPGHVLVMPRRNVPKMLDLTEEERTELWRTVRLVQQVVMSYEGCDACKLGVQDGRDAGQSVPHVHVHVLPIKA